MDRPLPKRELVVPQIPAANPLHIPQSFWSEGSAENMELPEYGWLDYFGRSPF
jgi:hypothetical protein